MAVNDATRQRLIDAAGPLFAAKGVEATSVRDITERAGVNVAAVHYHFRGTVPLYCEAFRQAATGCLNRATFPDWPPGTLPSQKLRDFIATFLRRVAVEIEPSWHPQILLREMAHPTEMCTEFTRDFVKPTLDVLEGVLRELLPEDVPASSRMLCASSVIGQCLHYRFARPVLKQLMGDDAFRELTVEVLTEHIFAFSLGALRSLSRVAQRARREAVP